LSDAFTVRSYRRDYHVEFADDPVKALDEALRPRDVVLADANVMARYPDLAGIACRHGRCLSVAPSEEAKSFQALNPVFERIFELGMTKTDRLVAIGGGVTQDIAAFVSSSLFRGIEWIFFPSNLLSQADSCIGSKISINFGEFKNQLGGFYPPSRIVIAPSFLASLGTADILSGLGEMMHYFCVSSEEDFSWAERHLEAARDDAQMMRACIVRSLGIKKRMIEVDEFDSGPRNVFNYGHSFGHALETVSGYRIPHGIAVSFGMDLANCVSVKLGLIPDSLRDRIRAVLSPVTRFIEPEPSMMDGFFQALARDKKNEGSKIKVILTRGLGQMFKTTLELDPDMRGFIEDYFTSRRWREKV